MPVVSAPSRVAPASARALASSSSSRRARRAAFARSRASPVVVASAMTSTARASSSTAPAPPRVLVLGGGFGGLYTALRLDALDWTRDEGTRPEITVVDRNDAFVFKPLLYELVNETMEPWEVAPTFDDLLAPTSRVTHVKGEVRSFAADEGGETRDGTPCSSGGGTCALADGTTLTYDYLVLALGTTTSDGGVGGARECAIGLNTERDAVRIVRALRRLEDEGRRARVAVIGGGFSGVELASVIAERVNGKSSGGSVDVVTPNGKVMASAPFGQREAAMKILEKDGVNVVDGRVSRLRKLVEDDSTSEAAGVFIFDDQGNEREEEYDIVCWTVGQRAETPSDWPVATTAAKKIKTDATLRVNGHSRIYAVGDASSSSADVMDANHDELPSTAQVAFQQADYAAWNIWASMNGRTELPFRYQHLGDMMVLGSLDAAVAFPVGDITLEGPAAAALRRLAYLYRMPTNEHRIKLGTKWIQDGIDQVQRDPTAFFEDIRKAFSL